MKRCINSDLNQILINPLNNSYSMAQLSQFKISKYEIDNYLLNTLLRDNDVLSMAHSLEVRPVLLDHKLVELIFSLNDNFKIKNGLLKSILIDSVKDIIPSEVYNKSKMGFAMPFVRWMNEPLNKKFESVVFDANANIYFNQEYLKNYNIK